MRIPVTLSEESIQNAIDILTQKQNELDEKLEQVIELLVNEGAEIARTAYGEWPVVTTPIADGTEGSIVVAGDMPLIAEFGAGQATMPVMFSNSPDTPVYEGSYSELKGSQEYYKYGSWHFGGEYFTEIPAKHGLLDAKNFIQENSTEIAQGVFAND